MSISQELIGIYQVSEFTGCNFDKQKSLVALHES